jgi:serine/threonine protein kinase
VLGQGAYGTVELGVDVQTGLTFVRQVLPGAVITCAAPSPADELCTLPQAVKEYSKSRLRKQIMERSVRERRSAAARGGRGGRGGLAPPPVPRWMGEDNPLTFISREVAIMKKLDHPNVCRARSPISLEAIPG